MSAPKYQRILLKLSGEALMGNDAYGINPQTIKKKISEVIHKHEEAKPEIDADDLEILKRKDVGNYIEKLRKQMMQYAKGYEFDKAAELRDRISKLEKEMLDS